MRIWLAILFTLSVLVSSPARAEDMMTPRVMTMIEWLNFEVRQSDMAVIGQVMADAYPAVQNGQVTATIKVGEVYHGIKVGPQIRVTLKSGWRGGKYTVPSPLMKDQWVLLFLKSDAGRWTAAPVGRVVETPYKGLTFYPSYNIILEDAAPTLSWKYVLDSLAQIVAVRREIINAHLPTLRASTTQEQRDRIKLSIEWQVKEQLGLPVP
jgi:hypothetical protein